MGELRERYFNTLKIRENESEKEKRKAALERAYNLRNFEIEHYWKRATYFWGFQIAIFAAFGFLWKGDTTNGWPLIGGALSSLGILTAIANSLSSCGSTFWQRNWERHIDMLEDEFEGRLYKTVWLHEGSVSFSVSRVNRTLSYCFIGFWLIVAFNFGWKYMNFELPEHFSTVWICALALVISTIFCAFWLFGQTTDPDGSVPRPDGSHGHPIKRCCRWCRRVDSKGSQIFVRRYAPDEGRNTHDFNEPQS